MSFITGLFSEVPFLLFPSDWLGWLGLFVWLGVLGISLWYWRGYNKNWDRTNWIILLVLISLTPITSLLLGIRLPILNSYPPPGIVLEPVGPALIIFSAVPWVWAAGLLGPAGAAVVAAISGFFLAYWDTHSVFTPLEYASLATLLAVAISQRYRTRWYSLLRYPTISVLCIALIYPLFNIPGIVFLTQGSLTARIDYAIMQLPTAWLTVGISLIIAGVVTEFLRMFMPLSWGGQPPWLPSPAESKLENRLIFGMAPLAVALVLTLMIANWVVAGDAAQKMLEERMSSASSLTANEIPIFLDTGQSLLLQFVADERLSDTSATPEELQDVLAQMLRSAPYFRQLFLLEQDGSSVTGYPLDVYDDDFASIEERIGIDLALNGVLIQAYTIPPLESDLSARITFIAPISNEETQRVLVGRTDLFTNPLSKSIITSLNSLEDVNGVGYLLDEDGRVIYHPDPSQLMELYPRPEYVEPKSYTDTAPDGTRQLAFFRPAVGRPWSVMMAVPSQSAQQLAVSLSAPILIMIIAIALIALFMMHMGLRLVTSSLATLAAQANRIAQGELDQPLPVEGNDEIAQLSRAFEKMRLRLKDRLLELNQLLEVSQGVASSLEMEKAVLPILKSVLSTGGVSARVVLAPAILPDTSEDDSQPSRFSFGQKADFYADLDEQILTMMMNEEDLVIPNTQTSSINFLPGTPHPSAMAAVALRHENMYYGVLWIAFDHPHSFTDEEMRFINTLAGQAALAASNSHLFMTAEIGRQRLAAILASTPDPVLVTDQRDRLLLLNPAGLQLFRTHARSDIGKPVSEVFDQPELVELMRASKTDDETIEVEFDNERIFLATASSVIADAKSVGRVCILQDVTHFKELDALKTEFVATVSHDLRSPLTLMRGYATMLEMVGDLNSQQEGYVQKIVVGVESMSRLVNNLLDLGRIEANVGLRLEMISVPYLVDQVIESLSLQAAQKKILVRTAVPNDTMPLVEADQALITQALHNLVENAIKYTPSGGDVRVNVRVQGANIIFLVRDTGIGVSPVDQPRLFERFYRSANREAKRERGTGLGLAIVKSIAERHGGQVGLQSQLGSGSTFFFSIPIRQPKQTP
jgi:signal transduction histidine kinase/HAMP domain-containing protein